MTAADNLTTILSSGMRLTAPLAFAACGEYLAHRAGAINISVEGMMLGAAFGSVAVASATGSATTGLVAGALVGLVIAMVHGNLVHRAHINTFVVGLVLNALVLGLTTFLIAISTFTSHQVSKIEIPLLSDLPLIGEALFTGRWPMYLLVLIIPLTWWLVERSRWGLELRAVGEDPIAADLTGIEVNKRRRQALMWCGLLAGLGGAYLAVGEVGSFNQNMTDGRGYIVLAAVIFGGWRLGRTMLGCVLFGLADAMRLALPSMGLTLDSHLLMATPYLLAIVVMLMFASSKREPRALAKPFQRTI
ncbi:ABC transporter permease [Rhodococcus sp. IEGM 1318]|uniref:ABC transporter permease n=1 Tax=Rhodococcus sp. IEGM 1318 TaxID=3082226 RepID=UPI002952FC1E|nr:ABC transporter permease [Rhodococcus sp. IEGM 1318]MDV8009228.1 ABC transporter permease [Rhodococcus sp. IEGM 1318]